MSGARRLRERWLAWRNRLLASPRFQARAARFPLTRPIARRHTRRLFDLCAGFVYSQVLMTCLRSGLLDVLAEGAADLDALAARVGLDRAATHRLLEAAVALDLAERLGEDRYALGSAGAAARGSPGIAAMVRHHELLYADLADPLALLAGEAGPTRLARYWGYAGAEAPGELGGADVEPYTALMGSSQSMIAEQVLAAYRFDRHRRLLDVGGGDASFAVAVARAVPWLEITVLDLPAVAERARERIAAAGLEGRVETLGGDFLTGALPGGHDLVSLVRVVHDHDDPEALALLQRAHAALAPGGRLLVAEPLADTPGAEPAGAAYFGFYLLAMGSGRPRRADELRSLLARAGFTRIRVLRSPIPLLARVVVAERAAGGEPSP